VPSQYAKTNPAARKSPTTMPSLKERGAAVGAVGGAATSTKRGTVDHQGVSVAHPGASAGRGCVRTASSSDAMARRRVSIVSSVGEGANGFLSCSSSSWNARVTSASLSCKTTRRTGSLVRSGCNSKAIFRRRSRASSSGVFFRHRGIGEAYVALADEREATTTEVEVEAVP
jgi:hypothetical protein